MTRRTGGPPRLPEMGLWLSWPYHGSGPGPSLEELFKIRRARWSARGESTEATRANPNQG